MSQGTKGSGTSVARARLLSTATRNFYTEGIHSVGVDRIIAEAQVTRATLYRHFAGKEDLVLAYLDLADRELRAQAETAQAGEESPADKVRAVCRTIAAGIRSPGFRGCAFLNAAVEYPDPPSRPCPSAVVPGHRDGTAGSDRRRGRRGRRPASRHAPGRGHGLRLPVRPRVGGRDLPAGHRGHPPNTLRLRVLPRRPDPRQVTSRPTGAQPGRTTHALGALSSISGRRHALGTLSAVRATRRCGTPSASPS